MLSFVLTWLALAALLHLPWMVRVLANAWYERVRSAHDHAIADDLPRTAGQWLRERLDHWTTAIVTSDRAPFSTNAFHVEAEVVQLTDVTHFKADPIYWATAAHELGHARIHRDFPILSGLSVAARAAMPVVAYLAVGLTVGNLLYGLPGATDVAFVLFALALALSFTILIDEAAASRWAYQELRGSAHLSVRHLRAVRAGLRAAFSTYVLSFASYALLLTQWWRIEQATGVGLFGAPVQLTLLGWIGAGFATVICGVHAGVSIRAMVLGRKLPSDALGQLIWKSALIAVVALGWNLSGDATWAGLVILASLQISSVFVMVVGLPATPLQMASGAVARRLGGRGHEISAAYAMAKHRGKQEIEAGNAWLKQRLQGLRARPLPSLLSLSYVPLLVALWWP